MRRFANYLSGERRPDPSAAQSPTRHSRMFSRARLVIAGSVASYPLLFLGPRVVQNIREAWNSARGDYQDLSHFTFEERRASVYAHAGYSFLRTVVDPMPERDIFPITKYMDYPQNAHLFFPTYRPNIDARFLAGIGLAPAALRENKITEAALDWQRYEGAMGTSLWAFRTIDNYDLCTRFRITFSKGNLPANVDARVVLMESRKNPVSLGSWSLSCQTNPLFIDIVLPEPVNDFSINRGETDFLLKIVIQSDPARPLPVQAVEVHGIKADITGYQVFYRRDDDFIAIERRFLASLRDNPDSSWLDYLRGIANVDLP